MHIHPIVAQTLRRGGVGVIPTDTIYGLAGLALNKKTVERIYKLRRRNPKKPFIVLIGSLADLKKFGIILAPKPYALITKFWPGPVSVVLPLPAGRQDARKFAYLHRGTKTLAFRYPKPKWLQELLKKTGPLISTSANFEGKPPAKTIRAAKIYFGDSVDFYVDTGGHDAKPSTLVEFRNGGVRVIREGAVDVLKRTGSTRNARRPQPAVS